MKAGEEQIGPGQDPEELPRRLCSEIQLFDLCDLERCSFKDGRYCTHADLLARFEALVEPDDRPVNRFDAYEEADEESYPEEYEDDDEQYSVFDDEDALEGRPDDEW